MTTTAGMQWPNLSSFAKRLRYVRIFAAGYTAASAFATDLGFKPSTYSTWENGEATRIDRAGIAERVCAQYPEVPFEWLTRDSHYVPSEQPPDDPEVHISSYVAAS